MKSLLLGFILALNLIPAPVEFKPAEGTSTVDKVVVRKHSLGFRKTVKDLPEFARKEAYRLSIGPRKVVIEARTDEGVFRARKTIEQLQALGEVPCGVIFDYPRFRHRGLMIDESRTFKGAQFLKKEMDAMALLKFNILHLHLDGQFLTAGLGEGLALEQMAGGAAGDDVHDRLLVAVGYTEIKPWTGPRARGSSARR